MSMAGSHRSSRAGRDNSSDVGANMPSGIRKQHRRNNNKAPKSAKSTSTGHTTASSTASQHQFLDDREKSAIENWNDTVPQKAARAKNVPEEQDPIIQAYLKAKLNLFRNITSTDTSMRAPQDTRTVGSRDS